MPKRTAKKTNARAARIAPEPSFMERALAIALRSPLDAAASAVAVAAIVAIIVNALFLQSGHHPAPLFRPMPMPSAAPQPAPAALPREAATPAAPQAAAQPLPRARPVDASTPRPPMPVTQPTNAKRDPVADLINASRRIAGVQRALTEFGYGQIKPDGVIGAETKAAIEAFEREQKLPVTGQLSDRLVRDLATMTGRPIE